MDQLQKKEKTVKVGIYIRVGNAEQLSLKEQKKSMEEIIEEINGSIFGEGRKVRCRQLLSGRRM